MRPLSRRLIHASASLVIGLALVGCAGYRPPSIAVLGARVLETSDEAIAIGFDVKLANPNDESIEIRGFDYTLAVDGKTVYSGRRAGQATLSPLGEKRLTIPAVIPFDRIGWSPSNRPGKAGYALRGSVLYITPGQLAEVLLDAGVRRPGAPFSDTGDIALP